VPAHDAGGTNRSGRDPLADTGEIYLELLRIDLGSDQEIVAFANRFQPLGARHNRFSAFAHIPGFASKIQPGLEAAWSGAAATDSVPRREGIEDFRFAARCIRDLTRSWAIHTDTARTFFDWEALPPNESWLDQHIATGARRRDRPDPRREALSVIDRLLPAGLAPFRPQIHAEPSRHYMDGRWPFANVPLYFVCCLELYNHIVEHATYRECGNCGRLFVRQAGRAQARQHRRRGVRYCSSRCARVAASRRHRQRNRAQA